MVDVLIFLLWPFGRSQRNETSYAVAPSTGVQRTIPGVGFAPFERLVGAAGAFILKPYFVLQPVASPPTLARTRA